MRAVLQKSLVAFLNPILGLRLYADPKDIVLFCRFGMGVVVRPVTDERGGSAPKTSEMLQLIVLTQSTGQQLALALQHRIRCRGKPNQQFEHSDSGSSSRSGHAAN
jgi:hypothetical protein